MLLLKIWFCKLSLTLKTTISLRFILVDYKELVLIENYCARSGDQILDQIGTSVTNDVGNIKFTFRQFAFTEIIDEGQCSLGDRTVLRALD